MRLLGHIGVSHSKGAYAANYWVETTYGKPRHCAGIYCLATYRE